MSLMPLTDVTNQTNIRRNEPLMQKVVVRDTQQKTTTQVVRVASAQAQLKRYRHEPYLWSYIATPPATPLPEADDAAAVCVVVVQHKCHVTECSSPFMVSTGQYVVIRGDRGIDIGVVVKVNPLSAVHPLPSIGILRYATQQEVDFWATDLKALEAAALEFCRQRVQRHKLPMEVRHAEYQYDQKKLYFYFDARQRVDFVVVLRELYREFGCRIWMEKV